jgi:hypothetical protein
MINKDMLFIIMVIFWILIDIAAYLIFGSIGIAVSTLSCITLFSVITMLKVHYKPFNTWLEKDIKE